MRWGGAVRWLCLAVFCGSACSRVTARQARRFESGQVEPHDTGGELEAAPLDTASLTGPRRQIVEAALARVRQPSSKLDCSGFVQTCYTSAGLTVPRTVRELLQAGRPVGGRELAAGDLVFFAFGRHGADHVGIYAGRGEFVHVSRAARRVRVGSLSDPVFAAAQVAARRLLEEPSTSPAPDGAATESHPPGAGRSEP